VLHRLDPQRREAGAQQLAHIPGDDDDFDHRALKA
jgi:hypothetical protein